MAKTKKKWRPDRNRRRWVLLDGGGVVAEIREGAHGYFANAGDPYSDEWFELMSDAKHYCEMLKST